ncbi:MAG: nucleoside 2-deoxyribosyltransferase, partial [Methanoregula sp.]|nr:nucleoside 2-deoxyribosyltransferase [Methanoregula sp.]
SEAEREYNLIIAGLLKENFFHMYLPQDTGDTHAGRSEREHLQIFEQNKKALQDADLVVAIIDGADADSGTAWEMGYATALRKPVIALRTDFRMVGNEELVNLMLEHSSHVVKNKTELLAALGSQLVEDSGS